MIVEVFNTQRDFNNKYPSKFFICSNCEKITDDKYNCFYCRWRADGLFKTMGKGYKYTIKETRVTEEIFCPIELKKENKNVRKYNEGF